MYPVLYEAARLGNWIVMDVYSDDFYFQRTPIKNTVLHVLAQFCDSENVVQLVLARNSRLLMKKNERGETALHLAARKGHLGVVRELILYAKSDAGYWFPPCFDRCKRMLRMANVAGNTALHEAVRNKFYEVAKLLVQEDPEFRYPFSYAVQTRTPLYLAVEKGCHDITDLILRSCKTPSYLGPGGKTALHAAAIGDFPELVNLILSKLPNIIRSADQFGWTALHYAAKFDHQEVVRRLLSAKRSMAYAAARKDDLKTALHVAVIHGRVGVVQELLSHCPDCWEKITHKRQNILHLAVRYERREVLEFVLQKPWASELIDQKDNEGDTPLHLYAATKELDGQSLVNHRFVDINSFDHSNSTPLDRILLDVELSEERRKKIKGHLEQTGAKAGIHNITAKRKAKASERDLSETLNKIREAYMIVATLIVTVTFAAGFTVPGGFESGDGHKKGMAILAKKAAFIVFVVSDSLALLLSMLVVLHQFVVRHRPDLFGDPSGLFSREALIGYAMTAMVVAFMSGLFAVTPIYGIKIYLCVVVAFFGYFFLVTIIQWRVAIAAGRSFFREQLRLRKEDVPSQVVAVDRSGTSDD